MPRKYSAEALAKQCLICGGWFEKKPSHSMKAWIEQTKFCSRPCYRVWWKVNVADRARALSVDAHPAGEAHPFWGKTHTPEAREKIAATHRGKPGLFLGKSHSEATKDQIRRSRRGKAVGPRNSLWKGGVTPINAKIRQSPEMADWRAAVFSRDDWTCRDCGQRGGRLNAHHVKPFAKFPDLRCEISNGVTVCQPCHLDRHRRAKTQ